MKPEGLDRIPDHPGVYLMKDAGGKVIYVGKANSLRKRVRSYFGRTHESPRLRALVHRIDQVETFLVGTEVEALILELNLIKEHRPRYNVMLKDDKKYPYIRVNAKDRYPRLFVTRVIVDDGSIYFGPYTDAKAMHRVLKLIQRIFPLRTCHYTFPSRTPVRLCLDYQIGKCLGPCEEKIGVDEYRKMVDHVVLFLKGKNRSLVKELRADMKRASSEKRYERAAILRDQVAAIERVTERQRITTGDFADRDVVALSGAEGEGELTAVLLRVREGKMIGKETFPLAAGAETEPLGPFLKRIYGGGTPVPREILCDRKIDDRKAVETWLSTMADGVVHIRVPQKGEKKRLVDLARSNAEHEREAAMIRKLARKDRSFEGLRGLKRELGLAVLPRRIECFDISNLGDRDLVGWIVGLLPRRVAGKVALPPLPDPDGRRHRRFRVDQRDRPAPVPPAPPRGRPAPRSAPRRRGQRPALQRHGGAPRYRRRRGARRLDREAGGGGLSSRSLRTDPSRRRSRPPPAPENPGRGAPVRRYLSETPAGGRDPAFRARRSRRSRP